MTAKEIITLIRELPEPERNEVFLGIMKDFNEEMSNNPEFMHQAAELMHSFMDERREHGDEVSEFEEIAGKQNNKTSSA